ncbi:hypothetical protein CRUP_035811 [Coryphaenoides rupestris]|nr:hypothetical protein CRUP_035811 [Coryphaenoides rupestris]
MLASPLVYQALLSVEKDTRQQLFVVMLTARPGSRPLLSPTATVHGDGGLGSPALCRGADGPGRDLERAQAKPAAEKRNHLRKCEEEEEEEEEEDGSPAFPASRERHAGPGWRAQTAERWAGELGSRAGALARDAGGQVAAERRGPGARGQQVDLRKGGAYRRICGRGLQVDLREGPTGGSEGGAQTVDLRKGGAYRQICGRSQQVDLRKGGAYKADLWRSQQVDLREGAYKWIGGRSQRAAVERPPRDSEALRCGVSEQQQPGDLIEIFRPGGYQHWAVYVGDDDVVHLTVSCNHGHVITSSMCPSGI